MSYIHGQGITAREVELEISHYGAQRFASLCNTIVWCSTAETKAPLPSLTENTDRSDGGIDGEWNGEMPSDLTETQLLKQGWNVFQYKQRDITKNDRKAIFSQLKTNLKGEAEKLYQRTKKPVNNYVLFVNLDLSHETEAENAAEAQVKTLKETIQEGYTGGNDASVQIIGAAEIASFLNNNPHVRSAYFGAEIFKSWGALLADHKNAKPNTPDTYIGREDELKELQSYVDDPTIKCLVIAGPPGIGKTRLALELTKEKSLYTIASIDPVSLTTEKLLSIIHPRKETIVIIEDPDERAIAGMTNEILSKEKVKLIVSLPTTAKAPTLLFGLDERVQAKVLSPLEEEGARKLIKGSEVPLDYGLETYIVNQAGGNPGILLTALSAKEQLKERRVDFFETVSNALKTEVERRLGDDVIPLIMPIALLTFVGVSGEDKQELQQITELFDLNNYAQVLRKLDNLKGAGVVVMRGNFAEVQPPLLANKLASDALLGKHKNIIKALKILNDKQRLRLVKRLQMLSSEEIEQAWRYFFDNGFFASFDLALENTELLRWIAFAEPQKTLNLLKRGLEEKGEEFGTKSRDDLKWIIEDLLFVKETSKDAMMLMAHLAKNETQSGISNNSEGVFAGCFWPHHPQFPLELNERLEVLRAIIQEENPESLRVLGARAIEEITERHGSIALKPSLGTRLVTVRPRTLNRDVWAYFDGVTDIAVKLAQNDKTKLGEKVREILPGVIGDYILQVPLEKSLAKGKLLTDWVLNGEVQISTSKWSSQLAYVKTILSGHLGDDLTDDQKKGLADSIDEIENCRSSIESGSSYTIRFKRWVGSWGYCDHEPVVGAEGKYRADYELERLAEEAVNNKDDLTNELITWALTKEAEKAHTFFSLLGQKDQKRIWLQRVDEFGEDEDGAKVIFSSYYAGFSTVDYENFEKRLEAIANKNEVKGVGIIFGLAYLKNGALGLRLITKLINSKKYQSGIGARILSYSTWFKSLTDQQFKEFLEIVVGEDLEYAETIISFVHNWLHNKKEIPNAAEDIIWKCLKRLPEIKLDNASYDFDQVASKLAKNNNEMAFDLLRVLLAQPYSNKSWKLFDLRCEREVFWNVVYDADPMRCLSAVYEVVVEDEMTDASFKIREIIDSFKAKYLIEFAKESLGKAKFVVKNLTEKNAEYWFIASEILKAYPGNVELEKKLYDSARMSSGMGIYSGPYSASLRNKAEQLNRFKDDSLLSDMIKAWVKEFQGELYKQADEEELREKNRSVEGHWY